LNLSLSSSEITSNELIANLTCFNSSKSLLNTAFLLFHFFPSMVFHQNKTTSFLPC